MCTILWFFLYLSGTNCVPLMNIFLVQHLRKKKELYDSHENVKIIVRVFGSERKRINITTGVEVQFGNWIQNWKDTHKKNPVSDREENSEEKNLLLKSRLKQVEDIVFEIEKDGLIPTTDLIKSRMLSGTKKREKKSLSEVHLLILLEKFQSWIKSDEYKILTQNSDSYIRSVLGSVKDLIRWTEIFQEREGIHLRPEDIDVSYITGLISYCDKRGLQSSTIKKRIKVLNSFKKWCIEQTGIVFVIPVPKKVFSEVEKNIIFLTRDDILQIDKFKDFDYENPNHKEYLEKGRMEYIKDFTPKLKKTKYKIRTSYEVYKDILLFLCGTGMRFGDMVNIRVSSKEFDSHDRNKGEFMYQSEKTNKITRVPLNRLTMSIFNKYSSGKQGEDYLFPRTTKGNPISNTKFNKHIKEISRIIGLTRGVKNPKYNLDKSIVKGSDIPVPLWGEVSSHIGRKTFIREQIEIGTPPRIIMSMTGHTSQKVFDGYYQILKGDRMKNNDKVFSTNLVEEEPKNEKGISQHQDEQLKKYKSLYDTGIIDREMYMEEIRRIMG